MGCKCSKVNPVNETAVKRVKYQSSSNTDNDDDNSILPQTNIRQDHEILAKLVGASDHVQIQVADSQAFNNTFIQQRQQAVDNRSYRATIETWRPKSLQQLTDLIKAFSKGKSLIDCHWIIYYWIACNIAYDTVSYFSKDYKDQSAEGVFRLKQGVCAGYANLYKYLCDQLQMPCEVVSGYSKGYGFENREGAPTKTDHAWNAVEIDHHWYLMESTWGAGHLNDQKAFQRELNSYYFLPRPNEMIYHHLPENEKWQLLTTPIKMTQYLQMPKLRPTYFELKIELISPRNQAFVSLLPNKSYALVIIRTPADVRLLTSLKLDNQEIEGGHHIVPDHQKQLYYCYFAPQRVGKHKIEIYGKRDTTETGSYPEVLDFALDVKTMPSTSISFPKTWDKFFDLGLEIVSPQNTHLIKLNNGVYSAQIRIKAPENVALLGRLQNDNGDKITGGERVYFDRRKNIWRCDFAPDRDGRFEAQIMAKTKSDPGNYTSALSFTIEAKQIPSPPVSYPNTWQQFYDLGLHVEAPQNRANAVWADNASYTEVLIRTPDDVQLSCDITYNQTKIENGSLTQFDSEKKLWQLLFAPERTGLHELTIYGKRKSDERSSSSSVAKFNLEVTKLRKPMKFPETFMEFHAKRCQLLNPMDGILKKGSVVSFHCVVPGATDVILSVDTKPLESGGYSNSILKRQITVGTNEVMIFAKYGQKSSYSGLLKYGVQ